MNTPTQRIEVVAERNRAEVLMHPLRIRILEAAREPGSAAELARRLELKPQKVNYHVQRLADYGFLRLVEERRAGNVVEKVYAAAAERYVLASDILGALSPRPLDTDMVTAARWLALQARAETELGDVLRGAEGEDEEVPAVTMDLEFRFETPEQRAVFARAARDLLEAIVSKYTSPDRPETGEPGAGRRYRLLLGCYPIPEPEPTTSGGSRPTGESTKRGMERGDNGERAED